MNIPYAGMVLSEKNDAALPLFSEAADSDCKPHLSLDVVVYQWRHVLTV
jgi:hypothetical protein